MAYSYGITEHRSGSGELTIEITETEVDPAAIGDVVPIDLGAPYRAVTLVSCKAYLGVAGGATTVQPEIYNSANTGFGLLEYQTATAAAQVYDQTYSGLATGSDGKIYYRSKPDNAQTALGTIVTVLKLRYGWSQ